MTQVEKRVHEPFKTPTKRMFKRGQLARHRPSKPIVEGLQMPILPECFRCGSGRKTLSVKLLNHLLTLAGIVLLFAVT